MSASASLDNGCGQLTRCLHFVRVSIPGFIHNTRAAQRVERPKSGDKRANTTSFQASGGRK